MAASSELIGIYIQPHDPSYAEPERDARDSKSSSGISSVTGSIATINNYEELPRKRNVSPDVPDSYYSTPFDEYEMEKMQRIMAQVDGDCTSGSILHSQRGSVDPTLMSSVFICVLILIFSISSYAFASLYRAVMKRMRTT